MNKFFMDHKSSPDWAVRRRIIILSLVWLAAIISAITIDAIIRPVTNPLLETIMINVVALFGGILGSYVFGAIYDRKVGAAADTAQSAVDNADTNTTTTTVDIKP